MITDNLNSLKVLWKQTTWHSQEDTILKYTKAQARLGEQNSYRFVSDKLYIEERSWLRL